MDHLDNDQLADLAAGRGAADQKAHLSGCERCRQLLVEWERVRTALGPVLLEGVHHSELHQLQALYRTHGPGEHVSVVEVLARLIRSSAGAQVPALRGGASAELLEFEADDTSMMLEVSPSGKTAFAVHGQVLCEGEASLEEGRVLMRGEGDTVAVEPLSEFGEFHIGLPSPGIYTMVVVLPTRRIRVDELHLGATSSA